MIDFDHDAALLPENAGHNKFNPLPVVRVIDLNDESISPGFRTSDDSLQTIEREIQAYVSRLLAADAAVALPDASTVTTAVPLPIGPKLKADSSVRSLLQNLAGTLPQSELRDYYSSDERSDRELLLVLRHVTTQQRIDFIGRVIAMADESREAESFVAGKLGNILHFVGASERVELVQQQLASGSLLRYAHAARIMGSCANLEELGQCVRAVGRNELLSGGSPSLHNLVAHAELGQAMRELPFPGLLTSSSAPQQIRAAADSLEAGLEQAAQLVLASPELRLSEVGARYLETALNNKEKLAAALKAPENWAEVRDIVNLLNVKSGVELYFGVLLSEQQPDFRTPGAQWSLGELVSVYSALSRLPENMLFKTPLFGEIQRVSHLGDGVLGARFPDGTIRISDYAVDHGGVAASFSGLTSLEVTLIHEIGHAVQIGAQPQSFERDHDGRIQVAEGDREYDFKEYMRLSGWEVIDPARWEFTDNLYTVIVDGQEVYTGYPAIIDGKEVTLVLVGGERPGTYVLMTHSTYAGFTCTSYSRTNPWEDWAEAFAEYFLAPERMIRLAPEKFKHLEEELRVYDDRPDLLAAMAKSLRQRGAHSDDSKDGSTPPLRNVAEQSLVAILSRSVREEMEEERAAR